MRQIDPTVRRQASRARIAIAVMLFVTVVVNYLDRVDDEVRDVTPAQGRSTAVGHIDLLGVVHCP